MKYTRICPKCNSGNILRIDGNVGPYGTGNNIRIGMFYGSAVPVNRYVCCGCGYSEEWIDKEDIEKLKNKYRK